VTIRRQASHASRLYSPVTPRCRPRLSPRPPLLSPRLGPQRSVALLLLPERKPARLNARPAKSDRPKMLQRPFFSSSLLPYSFWSVIVLGRLSDRPCLWSHLPFSSFLERLPHGVRFTLNTGHSHVRHLPPILFFPAPPSCRCPSILSQDAASDSSTTPFPLRLLVFLACHTVFLLPIFPQ